MDTRGLLSYFDPNFSTRLKNLQIVYEMFSEGEDGVQGTASMSAHLT